jgi:hypothetical protein
MTPFLTWPIELEACGGQALVAHRVAESQLAGELGTYQFARVGRRELLHASFLRQDFVCRYRFSSLGDGPMVLGEASMVSELDGDQYMAWTVKVGVRSVNVTLAFDEDRAFSLRCDRQGVISGLALPFGPCQVSALPRVTLRSYCGEAGTLASWSMASAVALCRCSDDNLRDVLAIQGALKGDAERQFEDMVEEYGLLLGAGKTGISLPSWRMDGVDS